MRIGTRASALALVQARWVAAQLTGDYELVEIRTAGDRGERIGDKERWVSELEAALLDGRIDVAVHSAKDLPGELAEGTEIVAVPAREDPHDVLVGAAALSALAKGARVGTASLRRAAQLRALRPDLEIVEVRGNVDTRLAKLAAGQCDALVLAAAGLRRLDRAAEIGCVLAELVPAAGQGALAIQARTDDAETRMRLRPGLQDVGAEMELTAERTFTAAIGASCATAVGAWAGGWSGGHRRLAHVELAAWVGLPDGSQWIADRVVGLPAAAGEQLAERMLKVGAGELLARAEELLARAGEPLARVEASS